MDDAEEMLGFYQDLLGTSGFEVIVADEKIVDVLDSQLIEVRERFGTVSPLHVLTYIEQH